MKFALFLKSSLLFNTVDSLYLELAREQQICLRYRKFEIEKITVKIKIFTTTAREVNKDLSGMY